MNMKEYKKMYWRSIFNLKSTLSVKGCSIKMLWILRGVHE